ncbi:MAG: hypothetical protein ACYC27_16660 [Armatimonadota bacterium]
MGKEDNFTSPPVILSPDRIWRPGPMRHAGQRTDTFLAISPAGNDFPLLWRQASAAVDQCSLPIIFMPGESPVTECIDTKAKVLSLTRLLFIEDGQLMLDTDEILRAAGIIGHASEHSASRFIHNENYSTVSLDDITYMLTTTRQL